MEDKAKPTETDGRDSQDDENVKFNPTDFLPRRTSRASAQAASEAIKKSLQEDKIDPSEQSAPGDTSKKDETKSITPKTSQVYKKTATKRKHSGNDCFVKLVRCEDDPALRSLVTQLKLQQKIASKKAGSLGTTVTMAKGGDAANKQSAGMLKLNGDPMSKYEIVYAPIYHTQKKFNHIIHVGPQKMVNKVSYAPTYANENDLKIGASGSKVRQASNENLAANTLSGPKSLSLVVVHPKPGATIVNIKKGTDSRSTLLKQMISDPSTIISNNISRVTASGGNAELKCNMCTRTFQVTRDLVNHTRLMHPCMDHICTTCAKEFPSGDALYSHVCQPKFCCEVCGAACKTESSLMTHKRMSHGKTMGPYMCFKCCFHTSSQLELNTHMCGGRPLVTPIRGRNSSSGVVYPGKGMEPNLKPSTSGTNPVYINLSAPSQGVGTSTQSLKSGSDGKFLCEVCLEMFPSDSALASHKCGQPSFVRASMAAPVMPSGSGSSQPPLPIQVLPEVEQLAKFYTSMVFKE
ncbi:myoneurin-like [Littorina saxatilis]|uniref:C2H2-type domain-containing protein n=1 Tax=Littorina saxatilis TaxID=31220 RepID=A0AAN9GQ21_9CAEN